MNDLNTCWYYRYMRFCRKEAVCWFIHKPTLFGAHHSRNSKSYMVSSCEEHEDEYGESDILKESRRVSYEEAVIFQIIDG